MKNLFILTVFAFLLSACGGSSSSDSSAHTPGPENKITTYSEATADEVMAALVNIQVNHEQSGDTDIYKMESMSVRSNLRHSDGGKQVSRFIDVKVTDNFDGTVTVTADIAPDDIKHYDDLWNTLSTLIDRPEMMIDCDQASVIAASRDADEYTDLFEEAVDYICA